VAVQEAKEMTDGGVEIISSRRRWGVGGEQRTEKT
jgi:hypothetical protein